MMNLIKQVFSLGLGAAITTKEQIEKTVDSLVKKGEVSKDESKELIKQWVEKGEQTKQELDEIIKTRVNQTLTSLKLVTKEEVRELERRIQLLENKENSSIDEH
jgi:polyhydroxyalkanoate synthesis regulator phasin